MGCKLLPIWGRALKKEMPGTINSGKNNSIKVVNKFLRAKCRLEREYRNPETHRQEGNSHARTSSSQLTSPLVHRKLRAEE